MSFNFHQTLLQSKKVRFGLVGVVNTAIDFCVLFLLVTFFSVPVIFANIVSTSTALCFSFLLNKRAVFRNSNEGLGRQIILFTSVTLTGLWVLQTVIIYVTTPIVEQFTGHATSLLIAKTIATIASLIWNYIWYSRVVFRNTSS